MSIFVYGYSGFFAPPPSKLEKCTSVECASQVAVSLKDSNITSTKFNAFLYDHRSKTCVLGNLSPFSANFDTASRIKRTNIATGSLYVLPHCIPKRKYIISKIGENKTSRLIISFYFNSINLI